MVGANVSRRLTIVLYPTLFGALISATFVYAGVLVLERQLPRSRLLVAWLTGWAAFVPVVFLVDEYILPGLVWLVAFALLVPVLVGEDLSVRASVSRAWRLARADLVHQLGSLLTLGVVVFLTQAVLAFVLRGFGDTTAWVTYFLASVVVSPVFVIGVALLYVDQAARVE